MCGICGIINFDSRLLIDPKVIISMRDTMIHRGPDDSDIYIERNVGFGHRRLSIIDTSPAGRQPMSNEDKSVWIVFNGEFYNYQQYIAELKRKGHIFKSKSDTEVILHLYEEYGLRETIGKIRGMFAFALWDKRKSEIFLVRDRFGVKPLYYLLQDRRIAFASEVKVFYKLYEFLPQIRNEAISEFFLFGRLLDSSTLLKDVFEVKPGSYLVIKDSSVKEILYYDLAKVKSLNSISEEDAINEIDRLFTQSVKRRLVSDVPIGVFLSGGLDSSLIALKMTEILQKPITTISIGYEKESANEFYWSDQVAKMINSCHMKFLDNPKDFFPYCLGLPISTTHL